MERIKGFIVEACLLRCKGNSLVPYSKKMISVLALLIILMMPVLMFPTQWTMFVYMVPDRALYNFAIDDIIEMQKGLFEGNINDLKIVVYISHISSHRNGVVEYLEIIPSSQDHVVSRVLRTIPNENSGSGDALLGFLNWAYPRFSSERNILSIWSHSSGWTPGPMRSGSDFNWICYDEVYRSAIGITTGELRSVFERHNKKYDIIILDACMTGSMEFITELEGFADYVIASPDEFPAEGFPWIQILPKWDHTFTTRQITHLIMSKFAEAYSLGGIYDFIRDRRVSVSVYSMEKHNYLMGAIELFSEVFANPEYSEYFSSIRGKIHSYGRFDLGDIDLLHFVEQVIASNNFNYNQKIVLNVLHNAVNNFVIYNHTQNSTIGHEHSISINYPLYFQHFIGIFEFFWHRLRFSQSGWARFLNYVYGEDKHPPNAVTDIKFEINLETIYIRWRAPIDPTPLTYRIVFYDDVGRFVKEYDSEINQLSAHISSSGHFTVEAIDEAGNFSEPVIQRFTFIEPDNNHFYIAPSPVNSRLNQFRVFYYLTRTSSFVNISIYNVAGQLVWESKEGFHERGEHSMVVNNLSTGVYFAVLQADGIRMVDRFAVVR